MMINKKLMALALLFFTVSILNYCYVKEHPKIVAISVEEFTGVSVYSNDKISYAIARISSDGSTLKCNGWAFIENQSSEFAKIAMTLVDSNGHSYVFPAIMTQREDVADAYKKDFYLQSGFSVSCKMSGLPEDTYAVNLYMNNEEHERYSTIQLPYTISFNGEDITEVVEDVSDF